MDTYTHRTRGEAAAASARAVSPADARVGGVVLLALSGLLLFSLSRPWMGVRTGDATRRFDAFDLPTVGLLVSAALIFMILGVIIENLTLGRWPATFPVMAVTLITGLTIVTLALEEFAAALLPTGLLPASVRRATIDIHGGIGVWLALAASLMFVIVGRLSDGVVASARRVGALPPRDLALGALGVVAVAIAAWARYQPWVAGQAFGDRVEIPGWAVPWVGPLGVGLLLLLVASLAVLPSTQGVAAPLGVAFAGWALSFTAALSIISGRVLAKADVSNWLPESARNQVPQLSPAWGAWVMFVVSVAAAGLGVFLVARRLEGGDRW